MVFYTGLDAPPSSWCVIGGDRQNHILLARDKRLYKLDRSDMQQEILETKTKEVNAFIEMAVSFDNRFLALFSDTGLLWIGSSDLQVK